MYADRKGWPLQEAVVRLKHQKIHSDDCRECEKENVKIDYIEREIELTGPLSDAQKEKMLEIAERCPVHRTLQSKISIKSFLGKIPAS
jgi:uncharacterized OsmC-like protein